MHHQPRVRRRPEVLAEGVTVTALASGRGASLQHLRLQPGAAVPEHAHGQEQLGYVVAGEQTLVVDGVETTVRAGESYALESDEPHAVENRGDVPAEAVVCFCPPRTRATWVTAPGGDRTPVE